jgi:Zn-finger protein
MDNSHKFFSNSRCKYYPCHIGIRPFNCMFCYCPLFHLEDCGGNYTVTATGYKDCSACHVPHLKDSWEYIVDRLAKEVPCKANEDSPEQGKKKPRKQTHAEPESNQT